MIKLYHGRRHKIALLGAAAIMSIMMAENVKAQDDDFTAGCAICGSVSSGPYKQTDQLTINKSSNMEGSTTSMSQSSLRKPLTQGIWIPWCPKGNIQSNFAADLST